MLFVKFLIKPLFIIKSRSRRPRGLTWVLIVVIESRFQKLFKRGTRLFISQSRRTVFKIDLIRSLSRRRKPLVVSSLSVTRASGFISSRPSPVLRVNFMLDGL